MLEKWQFNLLFIVGVGGAVILFIGPNLGLKTGNNPLAFTGVGAILAYVLQQRNALTKDHSKDDKPEGGGE